MPGKMNISYEIQSCCNRRDAPSALEIQFISVAEFPLDEFVDAMKEGFV